MNTRPYGIAFIPYIFDNKEAWESTIDDPRFRYNMPFNEFTEIYIEKRNLLRNMRLQNPLKETQHNPHLISQKEIDELAKRSVK